MDVKWFFVIVGIFLTIAILSGIYFISLYMSLQERHHFEQTQQAADDRYNNSAIIHEALYYNITDLKKALDPILAVIPNATQSEEERKLHYNQTATDFETIKEIMEIKIQDHETLEQVNQTVNELAGKNVSSSSTPSSSTNTTSSGDDNSTTILTDCDDKVIIENITGKDLLNKIGQC